MNRQVLVAPLVLLLSAFHPAFVTAQVAQAELRGTVLDESGAALPGATITATHVDTGTVRNTVTTATGTYLMPALPIGAYRVVAELAGFGSLAKEGIRLAVGDTAALDFTLKVATVAETITVQGESPLIDTKKSELSGKVEQRQVDGLPVNGRDWLGLVSLVPGARGNPGAIQVGSSGSDMAKYQVDGVDVTNQCCGGSNQGYSMENIEEFKVETNRYDAEYGRVNGAVINAVTKTGTNTVRGTGFGFFRQADFFGPFHDAASFYTQTILPFESEADRRQQRRSDRQEQGVLLRELRVSEAGRDRAAQHGVCAVQRQSAGRHDLALHDRARGRAAEQRASSVRPVFDLRLEAAERRGRRDDP